MDMSQQYFEEEVKHKIVKLHLEGRTLKSLAEKYGVSKASISNNYTAANAKQTKN